MQKMFDNIYAEKTFTELLSPEEVLLKLDKDEENIVLEPVQLVEFIREPEGNVGASNSDNLYISVHSPKMTIPVVFGFFDESLITEELRQRWPFLPTDLGL